MLAAALFAFSLLGSVSRGQDAIGVWPPTVQDAARALDEKYGEPDETTPRVLVWHDRSPWRRVAVYRQSIEDDFPFPHRDFVESTVDYIVPSSKATTLLKFDPALIIDAAGGTLSVRSDSERANVLALNLADELVRGRRSVRSARHTMVEAIRLDAAGKSSPYMDELRFQPASQASPRP